MNEDRNKLEYELTVVEKKLDKEKTKRNIIMIVLCSILCGFIFSTNNELDTIGSIIGLIVSSIIAGAISYFIAILAFAAVTDLFTHITYLQSRKIHLEEKLKTEQNNIQW